MRSTDLKLENAGSRGRRARTHRGRRALPHRRSPHIYAVGDVVGLPEPRLDVRRAGPARGVPSLRRARRTAAPALLPIGIYSIPEISYVGRTERELTAACDPVRGRHRALPRARARADPRRVHGVVKLLVSPDDRTLLGVHAFGAGATELVHIGQAVMGLGGTIDYLVDIRLQLPDARRGVQGRRARRASTSCAPSTFV